MTLVCRVFTMGLVLAFAAPALAGVGRRHRARPSSTRPIERPWRRPRRSKICSP